MFDDTKIEILGNNLKHIFADVQEYDEEIKEDGYNINVNKRLFIDYIEPLMVNNARIKIDNEVLIVVKVNNYSDYQEVYTSKIETIKVNDIAKEAIVQDTGDKIINYKEIIADYEFNTGDIIQYQNSNYLIISEVSHINSIYKATMRKTHHTLKFHVKNNKIFETPAIVDIQGQSLSEGRIISLADGKIQLLIKDTSEHRKIGILNRFILMGIAWEVEAITRELTGLIHIFAKKTQFNALDNKENEIAYNETANGSVPSTPVTPPQPTTPTTPYIYGSDIITLNRSKIYQVYDINDKAIVGKSFVFSLEKSDKNSNIEVNSLVTNFSVKDSISVEIAASSVRGYFNLVAKCNEDPSLILRKELRVKGLMDS